VPLSSLDAQSVAPRSPATHDAAATGEWASNSSRNATPVAAEGWNRICPLPRKPARKCTNTSDSLGIGVVWHVRRSYHLEPSAHDMPDTFDVVLDRLR
jgi:hypothetical protein